jgi:hypothetical protein
MSASSFDQPDNHDVWPNLEFTAASHRTGLVRYPFATVHIGNSNTLHIGRATGHAVLEARGEEVDRLLGPEVGADDYVPKPLN